MNWYTVYVSEPQTQPSGEVCPGATAYSSDHKKHEIALEKAKSFVGKQISPHYALPFIEIWEQYGTDYDNPDGMGKIEIIQKGIN